MSAPSLFDASDSRDLSPNDADAGSAFSAASPGRAATTSLYRKYRPHSFDADELVGQDHVVRTLRNAIALDRVAHAYLFSGPRGTGKTTTARLVAKAVNCLAPDPADRPCNHCPNCIAINAGSSPDIIEIDAASNRGIDDIRDLRERIRYAPSQLPSKVYIIDEAHQITGAAANAFLKTLEEPPAHTRFILATTDPEELLPTIVSRCQRFEFRRVSAEDMARRLRTVADLEAIRVTDDALRVIARHATGSLRDALGLLEQLALLGSDAPSEQAAIDADDVRAALGLSRNDRVEALVEALALRDAGAALRVVQTAIDDGEDPRQLNRQLVSYLRMLLLERSGATSEGDERAAALAGRFTLTDLAGHARRFGEIDFTIKHSPFPQLPLEIALVEATAAPAEPATRGDETPPAPSSEPETPPRRPTSLRERVRGSSPVQPSSSAPTPAAPRSDPAPVTPIRPTPAAEPPAPSVPANIDVEQIANLWPNVRADVKAINRRIEALLSEVDPVAIAGSQITLAVPYAFHRDKLNSDEVRETVASVLSRLLDRQVSLVCVLRGELNGGAGGGPPMAKSAPSVVTTPETAETGEGDERIQTRIRAAKNIFDAEEIEPASVVAKIPAPDGD
ncbi:MAG: DNA polymerase III subunit gamma/tau [Thermomicrobiales bacterium]|nr:DNA polymerase III subunit gamma/tau [Thermomicrobiales bacterium]